MDRTHGDGGGKHTKICENNTKRVKTNERWDMDLE